MLLRGKDIEPAGIHRLAASFGVEEGVAVPAIGEHAGAPAHLHSARDADRRAPMKIEEREHDPDAVARCDLEGCVHVPEHEAVESHRPAALTAVAAAGLAQRRRDAE